MTQDKQESVESVVSDVVIRFRGQTFFSPEGATEWLHQELTHILNFERSKADALREENARLNATITELYQKNSTATEARLEAELSTLKSENERLINSNSELWKYMSSSSDMMEYCKSKDELMKKLSTIKAENERLRQENDSLYAYKTVRGSHLELENERLEQELSTTKRQLKVYEEALAKISEVKYWPEKDWQDIVIWMSVLAQECLSATKLHEKNNSLRRLVEVAATVNTSIGRSKYGDKDNTFAPNGTVKNMYDLMEEFAEALAEVKKDFGL